MDLLQQINKYGTMLLWPHMPCILWRMNKTGKIEGVELGDSAEEAYTSGLYSLRYIWGRLSLPKEKYLVSFASILTY
jgi:hypothetical protein